MLKKPYVIAAVAGLAILSSAILGNAQQITPNTFSTDLQSSFDALADSRASLRAEIDAAIVGLTREEAQTVLATYADQKAALRDTERALRDEGVAEMKAAGVDVPERHDRAETGDQPTRGGEGGHPSGDHSGGQQGRGSN